MSTAEVAGFPNYEVTDDGAVWSRKSRKWLRLVPHRQGYMRVRLYRSNEPTGQLLLVARLVAAAFIPNPDGKPEVNHIDGDKTNNARGNLEWATRKENQRHATGAGLWKPHYGEAHGMAKLTLAQAREIVSMRGRATTRELATRYGVSMDNVRLILKGRAWPQAQQ